MMEPEIRREPRPLVLAGIALSGVLASGFLGGTTNASNGAVSPTSFVTILGSQEFVAVKNKRSVKNVVAALPHVTTMIIARAIE